MISYEIALGISLLGVIMVHGTIDLAELVRAQFGWTGILDVAAYSRQAMRLG
jgi:NADH:ubiquinone oxidoreductase subunit H